MNKPFPVVASILSPKALMRDVLPGYGLHSVVECKFYSAGFNHTYRIKTAGMGDFFLRAYRKPWRTLEDILYEIDVLNHLHDKGFPAIQPIPYKDGQYFIAIPAPEGQRFLVLFTAAPGEEINYAQEPELKSRRYGLAVAHMHNALEGFSSAHNRFQLDITHFIDQPLRNIEPFLAHRPDDWAYMNQFGQTLKEKLLALPISELEQGFCHGDLQGYHANAATDGTLTFYDFDCGGMGWRAYDLAVFLWCCRLEDAVKTRWEPFLTAYRENRIISDLDIQSVPLLVCARYLWHIGAHTQNSTDWGIDFLNNEYFDTHLKRLRDAETDYLN